MAATRLIAMHAGRKNTIASCLLARLDYAKNPEKTGEGLLVRTFECDAKTVDTEFLLSKKRYLQITGRKQKEGIIKNEKSKDVL